MVRSGAPLRVDGRGEERTGGKVVDVPREPRPPRTKDFPLGFIRPFKGEDGGDPIPGPRPPTTGAT